MKADKMEKNRNSKSQIKKILLKTIAIGPLVAFLLILGNLNRKGFFKEMSAREDVSWKAFWIRKSGDTKRQNFFFVARKKFSISFQPEEANLFVSCQARCNIFINNQVVQKVGIYSNPPYQHYDQLDIKKFIHQGENNIAVVGYNEGVDMFSAPAKPDGLLAQIEVRNGWKKEIIISDQRWEMSIATAWDQTNSKKIWKDYSGFEEIFDMAKFSHDWSEISINGNSWEKAEIIGRSPQSPWQKMTIRPIPYLKENSIPMIAFQEGDFVENNNFAKDNIAQFINESKKVVAPGVSRNANNLTGENNKFISLRLDKQITGGLKICFDNNREGIIDIGYAETVNENGLPDTGRMIFQGDRLLNPVSGCWQSFHPRSFKYIILVFREFKQPLKIKSVEAVQTEYPIELSKPDTNFSDQLLNKIYQVGIDTLKADMQETFMDSPVRERAQYLGDSRVQALVAYSLFENTLLQRKLLVEFAQSQESNGYFHSNYPTGHKINIPTYTLQWVNMLWEYYEKTNDIVTLTELYPTLERLLAYFQALENKFGLLASQPDWWVFIDHGSPIAIGKYNLALQISHYAALSDSRKIAEILNKPNTVKTFEQRANSLMEQINAQFWRKDAGLFDDCLEENSYCNHFSLQTNYWILYWNAAYAENQKILLQNLINDKYKLDPSLTPFFNGFIADVLFRYGYKQEAIKLIKNYWGGMIAAGATTWWESFDPKTKTTNPHFGEGMAHAWGSWPTYLLPKYLGN